MGATIDAAAEAAVRTVEVEGVEVRATVDPAALYEGAIGIVLDGELADTACGIDAGATWPMIRWRRLGLRLAQTLDFQDLRTGRRLLGSPLELAPLAAIAFEGVGFEGLSISGRFTLGWSPHDLLPLAFQDSTGCRVATGFAHAPGDGRYRFTLALCRLPAGAVTAVVGGLACGQPAAMFPAAGYVDRTEDDAVAGWAFDPRAEGPLRVEARRNGRMIASATCDQDRPDVAQAHPDAGACGFRLEVPRLERMRGAGEIEIVVAGTDTQLQNSPAHVQPLPARVGHFDIARRGLLEGWAIDAEADGPVEVEAHCEGVLVGRGVAGQFRDDLRQHGLQDGHCMFQIHLSPEQDALVGRLVDLTVAGRPIEGSPRVLQAGANQLRFLNRAARVTNDTLPRLRARLDARVGLRSVSLVMPVLGVEPDDLGPAIDGVLAQWCTRWELLCVADGLGEPAVARALARHAQRDPRIRIVASARQDGVGVARSAGFVAARSGYVALLDHRDVLEPDAVYHLLRGIRDTGADMLYLDSYTGPPGADRVESLDCRTAFSADGFFTAPFWPDLLCLRTKLARELGAASAPELIFGAIERADGIAHVPAFACRRSAGDPFHAAGHMAGHGTDQARRADHARATPGETSEPAGALFVVHGPEVRPGLEAELSPHGLVVRTQATDAASLNAATQADVATIVFIDGGASWPDARWIDRALALAARPGVGVAGPLLTRPDGTIVAAGLLLAPDGVRPLQATRAPIHDVSALPLASMAVRQSAFRAAGGFDVAMGEAADADLCLRIAGAGLKVLLDSTVGVVTTAVLDRAGAGAFRTRHAAAIAAGDPWYNPFLSDRGDWRLRADSLCPVHAPRIVRTRAAKQPGPVRRRRAKATTT